MPGHFKMKISRTKEKLIINVKYSKNKRMFHNRTRNTFISYLKNLNCINKDNGVIFSKQ